MRKLLPLVAVLAVVLSGCSSGIGPMRLKPGSNLVLPTRVSLKEILLKEAACAAFRADSVSKPGTGATTACKTDGPMTLQQPPR